MGNRPISKFYCCNLRNNNISSDNSLLTTPDFETGVAKIQQGVAYGNLMTRVEIDACKALLKSSVSLSDKETSSDDDSEEDITKAIATQEKRKVNKIEGQSKYINCGVVIFSAVIVEQLCCKGGCAPQEDLVCLLWSLR